MVLGFPTFWGHRILYKQECSVIMLDFLVRRMAIYHLTFSQVLCVSFPVGKTPASPNPSPFVSVWLIFLFVLCYCCQLVSDFSTGSPHLCPFPPKGPKQIFLASQKSEKNNKQDNSENVQRTFRNIKEENWPSLNFIVLFRLPF